MRTIKIQIGNGQFNENIYVTAINDTYETNTHMFHDVAAFAMKFRTYCITTNGSINDIHFCNWLNKYTDLHASSELPVVGRIDF